VGSSCALGIHPGEIEAVVLSHIHGDHIGGLSGLLPMAVEIVRKAKALSGDEVYLVLGGFHLGGKSQREIEGITSGFRRLGVRPVPQQW
jgi:metal-dependent hydrolase (beta-lactamase superfamily II)